MSDVNDIAEVRIVDADAKTVITGPLPVLSLGAPTTTYLLNSAATPFDGSGTSLDSQYTDCVWKIIDPKGNVHGSIDNQGSGVNTKRNLFPIYCVGTYTIETTWTDSSGATKTFTTELATVTQYDSGGGVMRDIPLDIAGNIQPIFEWIPNRADGYYNNGMAVFQTGTPTPYSSDYQCDILTKICRKKYLGTPPGAIHDHPNVAGTPDVLEQNYMQYDRIPQPLRRIPDALLAHKQGTLQSTCWCWAIKPKLGDWEGYTSLNRNIDLPEYVDHMGNVVPAMTYLCAAGISPTSMPVRTSLVKDGIDVTVLAFDRDKLQRKYYVGAEFEYFEINYKGTLSERWVAQAGFLGNTKISDSQATVEMVPWADLLNRPQGRELGVLCDVGVMHNEEFGTGRCRNQVLRDGPDKDDWTVALTFAHQDTATKNSFIWGEGSFPSTAISGAAISDADLNGHLINGQVEFTSGQNQGIVRTIASIDFSFGHANVIHLISDLPFLPVNGDTFHLTAGCRRTTTDCVFFNNIANFRGFPFVPGQEGVMRRYTED
jgi:hypothetical protein